MKNGRIWLSLLVSMLLLFPVGGALAEDVYTVGILQFVEHPALDAASEFFLKALADNGLVEGENLKVDLQNPSADFGNMDLMNGINRIGGLDLGFEDGYELTDTINGLGLPLPLATSASRFSPLVLR